MTNINKLIILRLGRSNYHHLRLSARKAQLLMGHRGKLLAFAFLVNYATTAAAYHLSAQLGLE